MPSKGGSRTRQGSTATMAAPVAAVFAEAMSGSPSFASAGLPFATDMAAAISDEVLDDDPAVGTPAWADLYSRAVDRYQQERERIDRDAAEAQVMWDEFLRLQGEEVPEGDRSLSTNDDLHRQLLEMANTAQASAYERENVIGDPNQTFGIEIEFDRGDPNAIARALHDAGLSASPNQEGYHSGRRTPGMWTVERDATVTGEIVSPVLQDTPETWDQLQRVCEILRQHGARVSARTGGHVHVGCDSANLDHDVNRFRRIASVCGWAEDLMYRLAAGSGPGRRHRGAGNRYHWCGPMRSGQFDDAQSLQDLAYRVGSSHSLGLNYGNILDSRRTIEYRYFDSSLEPARLQANIKLACWITKRAAELPDSAIPRDRVPLGSHADGNRANDNDQLLRRFADTVFVRPKDKLMLYWMYQRSAWQSLNSRAA
ncbi:MAG: amidoligase family protein [Candidatus Dormibacteria bacterium]